MRELQQTLIDGKDPTAALDARLTAMEAAGQDYAAWKPTVDAKLPFARLKWSGSLQQTNAAGVWVMDIPGGLFTAGMAIVGPVVRTPGDFSVAAAVSGTPAAGIKVTLTFTKRKASILVPLPAVVVGAAATNVTVNLNETSAGVVVFDVGFAEPDVIGAA